MSLPAVRGVRECFSLIAAETVVSLRHVFDCAGVLSKSLFHQEFTKRFSRSLKILWGGESGEKRRRVEGLEDSYTPF